MMAVEKNGRIKLIDIMFESPMVLELNNAKYHAQGKKD